jgi:MFS family permease
VVVSGESDYTRKTISAMAGLFLAGFLLFGVGVYSFTQFLEPLGHEFGWGRAGLGGLMSAFWISAPFAVVSAYLLPRIGVRKVVLIGTLIEAASLAFMVLATQQWQFIALRFGMGVGKVFIATPLPVMAARWFTRRPGLAIAISLCGWHCGGLLMAPLTAMIISATGWRGAALILALVMFAGMLGAIALLRDPHGRAEGEPAQTKQPSTDATPDTEGYITMVPLLIFGLGTIAFYTGYAGMLAQLSPLLADCGFDASTIGRLTGSVAISAALGVLVAGGLTQLLSVRWSGVIAIVLMGLTALAATQLTAISPGFVSIAVVILLGVLVGGGDPIFIDTLRQSVPSRYFDRGYGWWYMFTLVILALAPVLTGLVYDRTGSYRPAFLAIAASCFVATVLWALGLKLRTVQRRTGLAAPG